MDNDTIQIESAKAHVICKHKGWIERFFDVQLNIHENEKSNENEVIQSNTCEMAAQTADAPKNVDRAKKYTQAVTAGELQDFSITGIAQTYDVETVDNILHFKSDWEKECGTVNIHVASQGMNSVSITGDRTDVERTKQFIDSVATERHNQPVPKTFLPPNSACSQIYDNLKHLSDSDLKPSGSVYSGVIESDDDCSDDGQETLAQKNKSFPDYRNKLEFAFKLGYCEADLIKALKKLDMNAGQNELLSELIKNSTTRHETDDGMEIADVEYGGGDIADIQGSQMKAYIEDESSLLRHIIIDGSNVAMSHGNKELFSCMGIQLAVDWFREHGHTNITVFVPQWRKETSRSDTRIRDQYILTELERKKVVVFTPSRRIGGKRVVCYDDRYILKLAVETDGIVVSNDNYRDLIVENEQFKNVVEERLLMYSFVNDRFMPPDDPLGRNGPTLENFLLKEPAEPEPLPPPCPYGSKKCTYGNKCKFYHPERRTQPHKSVTEKLVEQAKQRMLEMRQKETSQQTADGKKKLTRTKTPLQRTHSGNPEEVRTSVNIEEPMGKNKDNRIDDYNLKLSESLMKMELERALSEPEQMRGSSSRTPEKRDYSLRSRLGDQQDRASPRLAELRQKGRGSPRGTSPVNLAVPGLPPDQPDESQKFLSGHLLLAKKLSDEATESDKLKKKTKPKCEDGLGNQNTKSPLAYTGVEGQQSELVKKQPLSHSSEKQKVSRQLSLQGCEDPRLSQVRVPLHAQLSYDPRRLRSEPLFAAAALSPTDRQMMLQDFIHVQHRDLDGGVERSSYGHDESPQHRSVAHNHLRGGHVTLGRMQSAPDTFQQTQSTSRQMPLMMRQNSSSDTQLNKMLSGDIQVDGMVARGSVDSMPMRDTTGSVRFQIGGPTTQNMPQYQPVGSAGQIISPVNPPRFQQTLHTDYHQQSLPFLSSHPLMPSHQHNFNQVHTHFHYSPTNVQYTDQSNLWNTQNQIEQNVSNYPHHFIGRNISPHTIPSNDPNLPPASSCTNQGLTHPFSMEVPILSNNPRFKLYTSLCNLFPEETVLTVMNQYPEVDNPKELCAYIINYS